MKWKLMKMKWQLKRLSKDIFNYGVATLFSAIALFLLNYTVSIGWNAITNTFKEEKKVETAVRQETLMSMPVPEAMPSYQTPQNNMPVVEEEQNIQGKVIDAFIDNTKGLREGITENLNETVETFLGKTIFKDVVDKQKERKPEMPNQQYIPQANLRPIKPQEAVFDKYQNPDNCKRGYIKRSNSPELLSCFN